MKSIYDSRRTSLLTTHVYLYIKIKMQYVLLHEVFLLLRQYSQS